MKNLLPQIQWDWWSIGRNNANLLFTCRSCFVLSFGAPFACLNVCVSASHLGHSVFGNCLLQVCVAMRVRVCGSVCACVGVCVWVCYKAPTLTWPRCPNLTPIEWQMRREQPWVYEKTCHCSGVVVLMSQIYKSTAALHWEERRCVRSYHVNSKNVNDSLEIQGNI